MNQQSNDNFDRLFRKAANKYPLKTSNKNWDIVAAKLNELKLTAKKKSNKRWQMAMLLLLITAVSLGLYSYIYQPSGIKIVSKNSTGTKADKLNATMQSSFSASNEKNIEQSYTKAPQQFQTIHNNKFSDNYRLSANHAKQVNHMFDNDGNAVVFDDHRTKYFELAGISKPTLNENLSIILKQLNKNASELLPVNKSIDNNNLIQQKKSQHIKLSVRPRTFLYGSFFMSPDFSTIKFQHINKPGFKIGVQLGYRISNSFSVEMNLVRYHSELYSTGKYFSTSNIRFKPNTVINTVSGKSKMTEIPFAIRYNIPKTNNHFFVTAGTTLAALIHTEQYNYDVTQNGATSVVSRHYNARKGTKYLSDINLSAGYQAPVLHSLSMKVEPYYQLPIKSFGVGNLPVTHVGLNIGIIKDLK